MKIFRLLAAVALAGAIAIVSSDALTAWYWGIVAGLLCVVTCNFLVAASAIAALEALDKAAKERA